MTAWTGDPFDRPDGEGIDVASFAVIIAIFALLVIVGVWQS
jgi:hypothetical protein